MLYYAPHPTNPDGEMGQYFRVAGELAGGGDPQPIEIPDDLIMQVGKRIFSVIVWVAWCKLCLLMGIMTY